MAIPTGCRPLDTLLGGGLHPKIMTQLYGPAGSGKTNVCLQALYSCVKLGKRVVYIDTEGGFSEKRLEQMCGKDTKKVLENTYLHNVTDFAQQGEVIRGIKNEEVDVIIVDSMTALYRLEKDGDTFHEINLELGRQLSVLLDYARNNKIPVLVTNQVYSDFNSGEIEPVGGDLLKYSSKIIVELQKHDNSVRRCILKKHLFKKEEDDAQFKIIERGLVEHEE